MDVDRGVEEDARHTLGEVTAVRAARVRATRELVAIADPVPVGIEVAVER